MPVAAPSKALFYGPSLAETAGSNPTGVIKVVFLIFFVLSGRGLCIGLITRRAVLPSVVCLSVIAKLRNGRP
jgi:hypothetical protein